MFQSSFTNSSISGGWWNDRSAQPSLRTPLKSKHGSTMNNNSLGIAGAMRMTMKGASFERFRMDVSSVNIANSHTIRMNGKDPYRRLIVAGKSTGNGPEATKLEQDKRPFIAKYDPGNPHADENGNVFYSNANPLEEAIEMISARSAHQANIQAFKGLEKMYEDALSIKK